MTCLPLLLCGLLGAEQVLDRFDYANDQSARQAWQASEGSSAVGVALLGDAQTLRLAAPFAGQPKLQRAVIDRIIKLDLRAPGEFRLQVAADHPEAVAHWTLYFHSGSGWYGCGATLPRLANDPAATARASGAGQTAAAAERSPQWQTLRFPKSRFGSEEAPAGWDQIDGIRIAAWRSEHTDATLYLRQLTAITREIALIVPDSRRRGEGGEARAAREQAAMIADMLGELGVETDQVDESSLVDSGIAGRRVAILAYCPQLSDAAVTALVKFVDGGGKVLVCYQLPAKLGEALGFGRAKYVRSERPGQFAEIRFDAADVPGLPASVRQASWNITDAQPMGHNARVIGRWFDDAGRPTGQAAVLLSDRGAFYSHIILSDDQATKKMMLAALLGQLYPDLWKQIAATAIASAGKVGHCADLDAWSAYIAQRTGQRLTSNPALALAESQFAAGRFVESYAAAQRARQGNCRAYLAAAESPPREGRAVWNHSGLGAYPGDWEKSAKLLGDNGFNIILPNMLWAGSAHYASDVLPRSGTFEKYGDQIRQCCDAAHRHGLEVHVWKVNFNLSNAPKDFVAKLRRAGRLQVTVKGEPHDWLCPSHPENRQLELESMLEVVRKHPVDGLHFDYIRYPGRECCYCDGCRARFEAETGQKVAHWPADCYSGPRKEAYHDWRCRQITALVAAVHDEAKKLRPTVKISAAVFGAYPDCRESVGQDWPEWIKAGYLDFVCPMDYTPSDEYFKSLVSKQLKLVGGRIPLYPGIGATASHMGLSPDRVVGQIYWARTLGAAGFTIFNFDRQTAESIVPAVGLGAGKQKATLPHGARD